MKRSPMPRKRVKPRRTTSPRCVRQRCNKAARIAGMCVSHAQQTADRLFSVKVRTSNPYCSMEGLVPRPCGGPLQAAHGEPRGNYAVRYDLRNVHSVCRDHHMLLDSGSKHALKAEWLQALLGTKGYLDLMEDAMRPAKRNEAIEAALHFLGGDGP